MVNHGLMDWVDFTADSHDNVLEMAAANKPIPVTLVRLYYSLRLALHELTHVEQYESEANQNMMIVMPIFTATGHWYYGLPVWAFGGLTSMFSGYYTAWLRGEQPYWGSVNEEGARGVVSCKYPEELRTIAA